MAETLAERRRRDEQVRATINQKLVDTGEKERCVGAEGVCASGPLLRWRSLWGLPPCRVGCSQCGDDSRRALCVNAQAQGAAPL